MGIVNPLAFPKWTGGSATPLGIELRMASSKLSFA